MMNKKIYEAYYNPEDGKMYGDKWFSRTRLIIPNKDYRYRDRLTGRVFQWNTKKYVDNSFFQTFDYSRFKATQLIQTNQIYLAKPGHRILGVLNGIDEDSASLVTRLNNTYELSFVINRYVDGEVTSYYNTICRHYELFVPHFGWFKITEEPELDGDGTTETKSITAESGEIELQQYDLVQFLINTGSVDSWEIIATDNSYEQDGYYMFHDPVRFYWDTHELEDAIVEFRETDGSVAALREFVQTHRFLIYHQSDTNPNLNIGCWRITQNADTGEIEIDASHVLTEKEKEEGTEYLDYTGIEILERELQREHELSLLWLILHEHGWNIGYVDTYVDENSDDQTDRIKLGERSGSFEIDSQDCYSFLTQDVASFFRCVFVFDTENCLVNAYSITNLGFNTDIVISFRNIQNEITRTSDQDLYTVFRVNGADGLDFAEVNFGSDTIEDISYFLNTNHFSQEFIDKYTHWRTVWENRRTEYALAALNYRNQNDIVTELEDRVPIDNVNGHQYNSMSMDELVSEREQMLALKSGFEHFYVDEEGNFDIDAIKASDDWPKYSALVEIVLSSPLDALDGIKFVQGEDSDEYEYILDKDTYNALHPDTPVASSDDLRLGNIDIAILNHNIIDGKYQDSSLSPIEQLKRININNQWDYLDNFQYDFNKYGYLYGVNELETLSKELFNNISTLHDTGYIASDFTPVDITAFEPSVTYYVRVEDEDVPYIYIVTTDTTPQKGTQYYIHEESWDVYNEEAYEQYIKYTNAYASCLKALEERKAERDSELEKLNTISETMSQLKKSVQITNTEFGFTDDELKLLDKYYICTDYTNENILTTSISTNEQIIDIKNNLYSDAVERLYVESHPQYVWSTTQDNLLLMPEFQQWHGSLHVGNFIRVAVRDDYYVKLRISQITLNPFLIEPTINIQFTNMTQYRSKRNDFIDLLSQANSSTKNSIQSIRRTAGNDETINVDSALILKLLNSPTFAKYSGAVTANQNLAASSIAADVVNSSYINVGKIVGSSAEFDELWADNLAANTVATKLLDADKAHIEDLTAEIITVGEDGITEITKDAIKTADISAEQITTGIVNTDRLNVTDIITVGEDGITEIANNAIKTAEITADQITSGTINANRIGADTVISKLVSADSAILNDLVADTAFIKKVQGESATWLTNTVNDQYVYNAVANKISVADLKAHTATADVLTLISEDGSHPSIAFKNSTQQFYDKDGNVRVQIGQDGNGNFTFLIVGEDGSTALFDSHGITQNGIPDDTIITDMIGDGEVTKEKVSFPVATANDDGTVSIATIKDGEGGSFGASYATFKKDTEDAISENSTAISTVQLDVDGLNNQITSKVEQSDINTSINKYDSSTVSTIRNQVSQNTTDISGITSTVSDITTTLSGKADGDDLNALEKRVSTAESNITQNADQIQLKVEQSDIDTSISNYDTNTISGLRNRLSTAESSITQNANQIKLKVEQSDIDSSISDYDTDTVSGLKNRLSAAESSITQNADNIELKVSKDGVISSINQSEEEIKISASKVNIEGAVTFTSLNTALQNRITNVESTVNNAIVQVDTAADILKTWTEDATLATTTINGGYIKTHTIESGQLATDAIMSTNYVESYALTDKTVYPEEIWVDDDNNVHFEAHHIDTEYPVITYEDINDVEWNKVGISAVDIVDDTVSLSLVKTNCYYSQSGSFFDLSNGNIFTPGFYVYNDLVGVGDENNWIEWDGSNLSINADSLKINSANAATQNFVKEKTIQVKQEAITIASQKSNEARKTATNYLYYSEDKGLVVHDGRESVVVDDDVDTLSKGNVRITTTGMDVYNGTTKTASYGSDVVIGPQKSSNIRINSNGLQYRNDNDEAFYVGVEQRVVAFWGSKEENETKPTGKDTHIKGKTDPSYTCVRHITNDYLYYANGEYIPNPNLRVMQKSATDPKCDVLLDYYIDQDGYIFAKLENENNDTLLTLIYDYNIRQYDGVTYYYNGKLKPDHIVENISAKNGYIKVEYEERDGTTYEYVYTSIYYDILINNDTSEIVDDIEPVLVAQSDTEVSSDEYIDDPEIIDGISFYRVCILPESVIVKSVIKTSDGSVLIQDEDWYIDEDRGLWVNDYLVTYTIAYLGDTKSPYFVFGPNTYSNEESAGRYSFAAGDHCSARGDCQAVFGRYNIQNPISSQAFIIGNGTDSDRSNAVTVDWSGNVSISGQLAQSSDKDLKDNISLIDGRYKDLFMDLKPVSYTWKDRRDKKSHLGLVAQDVQESFDRHNIQAGMVTKDQYYKLDYNELHMLTMMMTQKQENEIQALKQEVSELKEIIKQLTTNQCGNP